MWDVEGGGIGERPGGRQLRGLILPGTDRQNHEHNVSGLG